MVTRSRPLRSSSALGAGALAFGLATLGAGEVRAQECPQEQPLYCDDQGGYCCPSDAPYCCGTGCGYDSKCGQGGELCPETYPYDCGDGTCSKTQGACAGRCPEGFPYLCGDGTCSSEPCAPAEGECPDGFPVDCGNGSCAATEAACSGPGEPSCGAVEAPAGCTTVQSCCTNTECYFQTDDGQKFQCAAIGDCKDASQDLNDFCAEQDGCAASPGPARGGEGGLGAMIAMAVAACFRAATRNKSRH